MLKIDFRNPVISEDMEEIYTRLPETEILRSKAVYISGASGMIASYMAAYLIWLNEEYDYGIQIYAGIRRIEKATKRFGEYCGRGYFHLITEDVLQPLDENLRLDYIIHAASLASPQYYGSNPVETVAPNIIGTYQLLEFCRRRPVQGFLFFSSGSIYGRLNRKNDSGIKEFDYGVLQYLSAGNEYGESKRCGEMLCHAYWSEYKIPTVCGRITHTYGPTMDVYGDKRVFAEFTANVLDGNDIELKSNGKAVRQFAYATDTVTGLFKILLVGGRGEAYNVGNAHELHSISELAEMFISLRPEKKLKVIRSVRNDEGYSASSRRTETYSDTSKLERLGWGAVHTVKDGFDRVIKAIETAKVQHK